MTVDVNLSCELPVLHEAISEVFNTMIFMEIGSSDRIEEILEKVPCVMGSISFRGLYDGVLSIYCSAACAKEITMNLLAFEEDSELHSSDIPDAIGEVVNMMMGMLKNKLYDRLGEISVSIPSVIRGASMSNELCAGEVKTSTTVGVCDQYAMQVDLVCRVSGDKK